MADFKIATRIFIVDEGRKTKPYYDHKRFPTIGIGFRIVGADGKFLPKDAPLPAITMTIQEQMEKLPIMLEGYVDSITKVQPVFSTLNEVRQAVILSMIHQMGLEGCLKFRNMWAAINRGDFKRAGDEILDSDAGRDPLTENRMKRNRAMMQTGMLSTYYM